MSPHTPPRKTPPALKPKTTREGKRMFCCVNYPSGSTEPEGSTQHIADTKINGKREGFMKKFRKG